MTKENTRTAISTPKLTLFVYGTLKRGYWNFERYCRNAVDIQPATVWGRLYQLSAGYPALEIPETSILAHGTDDPLVDAQTQHRFESRKQPVQKPDGDWELVHGEVMTFLDPERDLPPIDRLEGFRANSNSASHFYRMIVVAHYKLRNIPVWLYSQKNQNNGLRIVSW